MNLEGRPKEIFVIVVGEFIKTAKPIGSEFLAENYDLDVSSATIRNDLAFLEDLGFLTKQHTSGGRVPTADGWHYFVENVWESSRMKEEEMARFENSVSNLISASLEVRECASKIFPEMSKDFLKRFLMDKIFTNYERRKYNNNIEATEESELEKCKKQSEEYLNGWKRAKADYLNLKKDMEQQGKEIKEWMSKMFILPLLEIMDNFDRAGTLDAGIESIKKQLEDYLKANGVEAMKVAGEKFDPLKHEAMESVDGDESGVVAEEKQKGYLMKDEVLRPAKVKVYK